MPMEIEQDGQKVTVYTAEDQAAAVAAAEKAAAEKAAEETRKAIEADPNGTAARARRDAESKLKQAEKDRDKALEDLQAAGATGEQLKDAGEQLAAATKEIDEAKKATDDLKATHQRDLQIIDQGVKAGKLPELKAVLQARGLDVTNAEAVTAALPELKAEYPGLFGEVKAPYNPNPGSTNPPGSHDPTQEELEAMTPEQFHAHLTKKGK